MGRFLISIALAISVIGDAQADQMTGNELLSLCQANPSLAIGYVTGVVEGSSRASQVVLSRYSATTLIKSPAEADAWVARLKAATKEIEGYCIPDGVTRAQSKDVACKYLQDTPAQRHLAGAFLIKSAFMKAWPCGDD